MAEIVEVEWENKDLSERYGMLYEISNGGATVNKSANDSCITLIREKHPRAHGTHVIVVRIESVPSSCDTYDGIGIASSTYTWTSCALHQAPSICFHLNGKIALNGAGVNQQPPLKAGDNLQFWLDCDRKSLTIKLNGSDIQELTLFDPPYHLCICCRKIGLQVSANILQEQKNDLMAKESAYLYSKLVLTTNISNGMLTFSKSVGGYIMFPATASSYNVFIDPGQKCVVDDITFNSHLWSKPSRKLPDACDVTELQFLQPQAMAFISLLESENSISSPAGSTLVAMDFLR